MISRRRFLQASLSSAAVVSMPVLTLAEEGMSKHNLPEMDYTLVMEETPVEVLPGTTTQAFTFNGGIPSPTLRVKQGKTVRIAVVNRLNQPTTIHWHGIRIDNAMDGVPGLTQPPIQPGETFIYEFEVPDAGTFWYHPHFNSLEQLSKGLVGALIVEEKELPAFDAEVVLGLKDWLLNDDGSYKPFTTPRNAARMGTLGNVKAVNGKQKPVYEIPAGGAVRVRLLNMDNTRVYTISLKDQLPDARVISSDGMPFVEPQPLDGYAIGAGMRIDLGLIAPEKVGEEIVIYDRKGRFHFEICRLRTVENSKAIAKAKAKAIPVLPANPIPEPDLENAEKLKFVFEWEGALSPTDASGKTDHVFWTINRRAWEGHHHGDSGHDMPAPLATLEKDKSYIIELRNSTPHHHPIHMHGEIFTVLESNKKNIVPHQADTVLLGKDEVVQIALKATNPGKWMFHCHVIEHMKTGLMGYIEIV